MLKRVAFASVITTAAVGLLCASQPNLKVKVVSKVSPADGRQMYMSYCASCHGADGRGKGPEASRLKTPPADLTRLSETNKGEFPSEYVTSVLQSGISAPGHGRTDMPVWGTIFAQMDGGQESLTKKLRIVNLSEYLKTIQAD